MPESATGEADRSPLGELSVWSGLHTDLLRCFVALALTVVPADSDNEQVELKKEDVQHPLYSGFIIDIDDAWFFITAGHVLTNIDEAHRAGLQVKSARMLDGFGIEVEHNWFHVVFDRSKWFVVDNDELGVDIAVLELGVNERKNLEVNGLVPVRAETAILSEDDNFEEYGIIGIPEETTERGYKADRSSLSTKINMAIPMLRVEPVSDQDESAASMMRPGTNFVGRIKSLKGRTESGSRTLRDIGGMSGGPVFGFKCEGDDILYKLVGIQSSWNRKEKLVNVCRIDHFLHWFQDYTNTRAALLRTGWPDESMMGPIVDSVISDFSESDRGTALDLLSKLDDAKRDLGVFRLLMREAQGNVDSLDKAIESVNASSRSIKT